MNPTRKNKLFILSGASGIGKSTAAEVLFHKEEDYIVMESDLLWHDMYNTPEDNYRQYRELWMNVCSNISQIGKPVVLCGCGIPEQFEICEARSRFTEVHYIAVVAEAEVLENRMRKGRQIEDENWIKSSRDFNLWLKNNAHLTTPGMQLIDSTHKTPEEVAASIHHIIMRHMSLED